MEPRISKIVARIQACLNVKTLLPTLVPNEFATSFAPMPNAKMKATKKPAIISQKSSKEYGSRTDTMIMCLFLLYNSKER